MTENLCTTCNQQYSQTAKQNILSKLPELPNITSTGKCITCYQAEIRAHKATLTPALKEIKPLMEEAKQTYHKLYLKWRSLADNYTQYDYNDNMIIHQLALTDQKQSRLAKEKAASQAKLNKIKPTKQPADKQKAMILNLMKNLSVTQQADIIAKMGAQTS